MTVTANMKALGAILPFSRGDGSRLLFSGWNRAPMSPIVWDRINWQGTQQLYSTARTNLVIQSQNFDNASWGKGFGGTGVAPVVTPNVGVAPDGTLTADQVVFNAGAGTTSADLSLLTQNQTVVAAAPYTGSIWVNFPAGTQLIFRQAGASTFTTVTCTGKWQQVSSVETALSTGCVFTLGIRQGVVGTLNATATGLVWGAQLTAGSVVSSYIPTTTGTVTVTDYTGTNPITLAQTTNPAVNQLVATNNGKGDGTTTAFTVTPSGTTPTLTALYKIDWQGKNLLYTTSRTNQHLHSNDMSQAQHIKTNLLSNAAVLGPDGVQNVNLVVPNTTSGLHFTSLQWSAATATTNYCLSSVFKPSGYSKAAIRESFNGCYATFDLTGAGSVITSVGTVSAGIVALADGSYLCWITALSTGTNVAMQRFVLPTSYTTGNPASTNWAPDGTSGLQFGYAQIELGTVPTSRIVTAGTAVTVTDYSLATNTATLSPAPAVGSLISWDGSYVGGLGVDEFVARQLIDQLGKVI